MKTSFKLIVAFALAATVFVGCKKVDIDLNGKTTSTSKDLPANVALDWYRLQLRFLLERNSSLNGAYFGYLGIGLYESVRYSISNSVSFSDKLYQMPAMPAKENNNGYSWELSANAAMADMLRSFNTGLTAANLASIDSLESLYNGKLSPAAGSTVFKRSQTFGRSVAKSVYDWSLTDKFNPSNVGYIPPVFDGSWVPTLPAQVNGVMPYLKDARPFLQEHLTTVAPVFPAPYSELVNSDFYNIVKEVYDVSQTLTDAEKATALFWVDQGNGVGYTPPGHDFSIVLQILAQKKYSLQIAAEVFAKAGIAERDATLVCFKSKYTYNLLRPITYIRKVIDPNWMPFIVTPPHPEYPAAHSFITGAVMQAATKVIGDAISVTDHTYDFRGWPSRKFVSLFSTAEEAGISRLYGGIHYHTSINIGLTEGKALGNRVGDIILH